MPNVQRRSSRSANERSWEGTGSQLRHRGDMGLLFGRLEHAPPPAAVARLALELDGTTPAAGQQLPLFTPQAARGARLEWQLARLALTFGEDRVRRVEVTDPEALPERRWACRRVISGDRGVPR